MTATNVFLSYTSADRDWARRFASALREAGIGVWFDEWEIAVGEPTSDAFEHALRESDTVVTLLSASSVASAGVNFEIGAALGLRKRLIPVVLPDLSPHDLPGVIRSRRFIAEATPESAAQEVAAALTGRDEPRGVGRV